MKNIIYIIAILSLVGIACTDLTEDLYDSLPESVYPENEAQVAALAVNAYVGLKPLIDDEGWWFLAQEISSDELCGPTRDADWYDGGKWLNVHWHTWSNEDESVNRLWDKLTDGVVKANSTLDFMSGLPESELIEKKKSEVKVVRAFFHYLMIDNFGDIPYVTNIDDVSENPMKISRAAAFDSVTTTLESILPNLKLIDNNYMATRYTAFAILAKLYLNAEVYTGTPQWTKADAFIDSILAGPFVFGSDVSAPFATQNNNDPEIIFSIPYDEDTYHGFRLHMRTLHYQHNLTYDMPVGPWNGFAVTPNHFNIYEDEDLRKKAYFIYGLQKDINGKVIQDAVTKEDLDINPILPAIYMTAETHTPTEIRTTGARIGKYEIAIGAKENLSNDFPLFRITDFYLMKAETQIRLLGAGSGDDWINPVRTRAGVTTWSGATLDNLLEERGRELWVEGHRRQDLIRFGKFTNAWWGKGDSQGGVAGDPTVKIFPIPKYATDANPNLLLDPQ